MKSPLGRFDPCPTPHYQDRLAKVVRREKPKVVVETGLLDGFGAEFILKALDDNGSGHLYSIDPMDPKHFANSSYGFPEMYFAHPIVHPRFTFIRKYSTEALEPLFKEVGPFGLFVHDSDHNFETQTFEYESAWRMVRPGGIIASDDILWGDPPHQAWAKFLARHNISPSSVRMIGNAAYFRKP